MVALAVGCWCCCTFVYARFDNTVTVLLYIVTYLWD